MIEGYRKIPCVIQRGGTSKGVYLHEKDLPKDPDIRQKVILSIFGSPDIRQIDGLGGADPLTSKCAIIGPSERPDADVDYTMAQVGRHRLAQAYAVFERPNETADDVDTRQDDTSPAENTEANELTRQIDSTAKPGTAQMENLLAYKSSVGESGLV